MEVFFRPLWRRWDRSQCRFSCSLNSRVNQTLHFFGFFADFELSD
jgi:hypothetical protein